MNIRVPSGRRHPQVRPNWDHRRSRTSITRKKTDIEFVSNPHVPAAIKIELDQAGSATATRPSYRWTSPSQYSC